MRRNGNSNESSSSSSLITGLVSLAGGVGIGAGLLYLLDPDKGAKRRQQMLDRASGLASSAKGYAGETFDNVGSALSSALGSARDYAGEKLSGARDYARDYAGDAMSDAGSYASKQMRRAQRQARDFIDRQTFGETHAQHRMGVTICALGSMALGAALMYVFDPAMGRGRRRYVKEQAENLASEAGNYARQAGDAIRTGVEQVKEKVSGGTTSGGAGPSSQQNPAPMTM
jgi:hypothetical protein